MRITRWLKNLVGWHGMPQPTTAWGQTKVVTQRGLMTMDIGKQSCPSCRHPIDVGTTAVRRSNGPEPGDIGLCYYCGAVLEFHSGALRLIPEYVWEALSSSVKQQIALASKAIGPGKERLSTDTIEELLR